MRVLTLTAALCAATSLAVIPADASAGGVPAGPFPSCAAETARPDPWAVDFGAGPAGRTAPSLRDPAVGEQAAPAKRVLPVEHSEGYKTRAKIHKVASFASLPLFVTDFALWDRSSTPTRATSR